jgi:hypothetical protein
MIRGGTSWDNFASQGAWAINTDLLDDLVGWRNAQ